MQSFFHLLRPAQSIVSAADALSGRQTAMPVPDRHAVLNTPLRPPFADNLLQAVFAMGCFWGAEKIFWQLEGVHTTAVGYTGGHTPNANYDEVCSGRTAHAEAVLVVYDPKKIDYRELLRAFWQSHDPTQGMRQGNDVGSQYRSAIYAHTAEQLAQAKKSRDDYQAQITAAGYGNITTEIARACDFYYAEAIHQQYLAKNPNGYCGLGGTGVLCR